MAQNLDAKYTIELNWKLEIGQMKVSLPVTINVSLPDAFYEKFGPKLMKVLNRTWEKEVAFL